jgi:hypothetical protein
MEPSKPDSADNFSTQGGAGEESGAQSSAAEASAYAARDDVANGREAGDAEEEEEDVSFEARVEEAISAWMPSFPPGSAASSGDLISNSRFSLLASDDTTVPPSTDGYICPLGDERWERLQVGDKVPKCSKHGLELIPIR